MTTDHNEAMRLADAITDYSRLGFETEDQSKLRRMTAHKEAAALLRKQAERIAELEAERAEIIQAITDPENQPSQYGTVTIDMHAEDGFVIERMGQLLAETVLILRGPPPKLTRWSYHDIPERVAALAAERDTLRADADRYRWLRAAHWSSAPLCCVLDPKANVRLGATCPSGDQLDTAIDTARKATP